jgi:UDP-N-acetylglucosamine acyltransferase
MDRVSISHDCVVGDDVTIAHGVVVAGTVTIGPKAWIGMNSSIHQRRSVGEGAMIGMGSVVTRDIPPWEKWYGNPARSHGWNSVGAARHGVALPALEESGEPGDFEAN